MPYLINIFAINYVTFNDIFLLTREDLIEMKIPIGSRNKLLHFIQEYKKYMKNSNLEELSNFFNLYNNNNSYLTETKIGDNYPPSTMPTTNNDFSYRIKGNYNYSNNLVKGKKEENNLGVNYNDIYYINSRDNFSQNNNINNNSLLNNSSYNYKKINKVKNNKYIYKRNPYCLRNLKTTSYLNSKINKNNSLIYKTKILSSNINNEYKLNKNNNTNQNNKENIENNNLNESKNKKISKPINKNFYFRNPLIKLIEDSQTNRTLSIINGQLVSRTNYNITSNNNNIINTYEKSNDNISYMNDINNKHEKKKMKKKINKNLIKSNSTLISNLKIKNTSKNNNNIYQSINSKIIESFNNLNDEVECFQNQYKKMKKESYDRKNRIKSLLVEEKRSSRKFKFLKQQIKNIKKSNKLRNLKNDNINNLNDGYIKKNIDKNFILKNINNNNDISLNNNNNISNNKINALVYELEIENVK